MAQTGLYAKVETMSWIKTIGYKIAYSEISFWLAREKTLLFHYLLRLLSCFGVMLSVLYLIRGGENWKRNKSDILFGLLLMILYFGFLFSSYNNTLYYWITIAIWIVYLLTSNHIKRKREERHKNNHINS